ncbi:hypothetical protein [Actinocorallia longicatena]
MRTSQPTASSNSAGAHGLGTGLAAQRLPVAPRERKPALAALAVLLILGGALVSGYLVIASGERVAAIEVVESIGAGELIPESALREVTIGKTGISYVPWAQKNQVAGRYAAVGLVPDTLLTPAMVTEAKDTLKGRVLVGLALKTSQYPPQTIRLGSTVALYAVGARTDAAVAKPGVLLTTTALVQQIGVQTGRTGGNGDTRFSVAVVPQEAAAITQAASSGNIVMVLVPPGVTVPIPPPVKGTVPKTGG